MRWALDLDGVVFLGNEPIPGAREAVERLRARGDRVVFLTNNSALPVDAYVDKLQGMGLEIEPEELVTSAQSAARLVQSGQTALVVGGDGIREALVERGVTVIDEGQADAVVVGGYRTFDFDRLTAAMRALRAGAFLIGTNDDATYPSPTGLLPGAGSLLAAVSTAGGVSAVVAGKPYPPMADLVADRVGKVDIVVGDQPATDGLFARHIGARFALVLSGITTEADFPVVPEPDDVAPALGSLVA